MLRWVVYLATVVLLIALITAPTEKEFHTYIIAKTDTTFCKPFVQFRSYRLLYFDLFSINTSRECHINNVSRAGTTLSFDQSSRSDEENRYLGIFGTFWKL